MMMQRYRPHGTLESARLSAFETQYPGTDSHDYVLAHHSKKAALTSPLTGDAQMKLPGDPAVIAIVGAGEMGAAVGRRLREAGARILISLNGRSTASADRVHRAGLEVVYDDRTFTDGVDYILSIVPPSAAVEVAERLRTPLRHTASPPLFVDCNAVAPTTMRGISRTCSSRSSSSTPALSGDRRSRAPRIRPPDPASTSPGRTLIGSSPSLATASILS
jgi:6-phosphogluconate dehydrogenase-like protein